MATTWQLDPTHSELGFKIKHLMITNIKGEFRNFSAEIDGEDFSKATISAMIDTSSIFTNEDNRDAHLKNADFFDVDNHKEMTFKGSSLNKIDDENFELTGMLSIKGISKEIKLGVEYGGTSTDPWGNEKMGFSINGKINRSDYGLNFNAALETGGFLLGEEVKISADLQFVKK
ncbi:MAG: YceI family protein [Crocinitomicaceae bacterium]|jgi:polyisoprenoid-binding protein YceI|nr:YceI family protein [Crocinitomicaceae bacterium]